MLTHIFEALSIDILSNWCDLKTVAKVNSAFCTKKERLVFLCLLNDSTFDSTDSSYYSSDAFWNWIVLNGIKMQHVKGRLPVQCTETLDCSKVDVFHMVRTQKLTAQVAELTNKMIHLKVLTVYDFDFDYDYHYELKVNRTAGTSLKTFFSLVSGDILSGLTALTIIGEHRESFQNPLDLSKIASACSQLRSLSVSKWNNGINEHTLVQIIQTNKQLQRLTLKGCDCRTAVMRAISESCAELESLDVEDLHANNSSTESVREMLKCCKLLTNCRLGGELHLSSLHDLDAPQLSKFNEPLVLQIRRREFLPICSVIYELHKEKLMTIQLCGRIEEKLLMQISEGCPQLTELCISERWYSWSVDTLRSIVTCCTLLRKLQLSYVDATHDEMIGIFCSGRVLVLTTLDVLTTTPHYALTGCITEKNSSIVYCRTVQVLQNGIL
jgi:hypothetical protein